MRRRGFAAVVVLAALAGTATADPLTSDVQPPLGGGGALVAERARLEVANDGPSPEDADETTVVLTTMGAFAPHDRLTVMATLDVMWRDAELSSPGGERVERSAGGLGDLTVLASSPLRASLLGGAAVLAPFAGLKIPTGADDQSDMFGRLPQQLQVGTGAFDVPLGALASWRGSGLALFAAATYTFRTEANEFDAGDSLRGDLAAQRSLLRAGDVELSAALESYALWRAADRGRLAPAESGGLSWFGCPGLRARFGRHVVETAVELPITQPFDRHVDVVLRAGYRVALSQDP